MPEDILLQKHSTSLWYWFASGKTRICT